MKNKAGKMVLFTGVMCMLSLALCACGGEKETPKVQEQQEDLEGEAPEEDASVPEPDEDGSSGTGTAPQEPQEEQDDTSAKWNDSAYDLEGNIKELKDGEFTMIEAITETLENGEAMMIMSPESEEDPEFNKVTIAYDQDTLFQIQTIYDGGARSEMSEATAKDLESGQLVKVWGNTTGESWKADQICIVKVKS